jgi:hypothetical protein
MGCLRRGPGKLFPCGGRFITLSGAAFRLPGDRTQSISEGNPLLANRLIEMIETHAEFLTREVLKDIATNPRTRHWGVVPSNELEQRVFRTYLNLGNWIGDPKEDKVQAEYEDWGSRRYRSGIPLSEIIYAVILLKHHLRRYIRDHGLVEYSRDKQAPQEILPVHLYGIQELNYLVGEFFDKALYHLAQGYEKEAQAAQGKPRG